MSPLGGLTDVPLMRAGGVSAQLTACWMPDVRIGGPTAAGSPFGTSWRWLDYVHRELDGEAGDYVVLARTAGDIEGAAAQSKAAFVLGLEGGDALQGDPDRLRTLYLAGPAPCLPRPRGTERHCRGDAGLGGADHARLRPQDRCPGRTECRRQADRREMNRLGNAGGRHPHDRGELLGHAGGLDCARDRLPRECAFSAGYRKALDR